MDTQMRTTFIPKQVVQTPPQALGNSSRPVRSVGILSVIAVILFFVGVISAGGAWLYHQTLTQKVKQISQQLLSAEKQFEPGFIEELNDTDYRLTYANQVLRNHRSIAPIFDALQKATLKSVQFDSFRYDFTEENGGVIQIEGEARSYKAIAQQSKAFSQENFIREHIFSNFNLQDNAHIHFELTITLAPDAIRYEEWYRLNQVQVAPVAEAPAGDSTSGVVSQTPGASSNAFPQ